MGESDVQSDRPFYSFSQPGQADHAILTHKILTLVDLVLFTHLVYRTFIYHDVSYGEILTNLELCL